MHLFAYPGARSAARNPRTRQVLDLKTGLANKQLVVLQML